MVTVFDGDMADKAHREKHGARIAYMPQGLGRNLYPTLSVFENIDFHGRLFGQGEAERRRRIDELLQATGLDPFEDRPAGKLSGGMKQKLSLCCALIHDPDLLILDEPTTGVDPLSRGQFWDLINTIRSRRPQMSVIVATAYMDEAERFDWLAAMDDGKVIASGPVDEILAKTGQKSLEAAFIALLPEAKRAHHQEVVVRPRPASDSDVPAIEAEGLTRRSRRFHRRRPCQLPDPARRDLRLPRLEWLRQIDGDEDAHRAAAGEARARPNCSASRWARTTWRRGGTSGYMSQAFSLYTELTVRQNLELHAKPLSISRARRSEGAHRRAARALRSEATWPMPVPTACRSASSQRLQLAVAVLHRPAMLILDEPTSGVDPIARDAFWRTLIDLSRDDGVTIFLSTHFMNEAERCDRISLMHAGKRARRRHARGSVRERGSASQEDTFVDYLAEAAGIDREARTEAPDPNAAAPAPEPIRSPRRFDPKRLWAYSRRETMELLRDPIRLAFAFLGPLVLMIAFGFGISFDVENLRFSALDHDNTPESRQLVEAFSGLALFRGAPAAAKFRRTRPAPAHRRTPARHRDPAGLRARLAIGPEARGRGLARWCHAVPRRDDQGLCHRARRAIRQGMAGPEQHRHERRQPDQYRDALPLQSGLQERQRHGAERDHADADPDPGDHVGDCRRREKETGSIANFQSTPITKFEFLFGKQLPYIAIAMHQLRGCWSLLRRSRCSACRSPGLGGDCWPSEPRLYVAATTGFGQLDLDLRRQDAGLGGVRHRDPLDHPGGELLRTASFRSPSLSGGARA